MDRAVGLPRIHVVLQHTLHIPVCIVGVCRVSRFFHLFVHIVRACRFVAVAIEARHRD